MVIWIITLLDRYSFVHFLSVDDPPADMLENTPRVELAMTPSTMYSPLMPLSRCFLHQDPAVYDLMESSFSHWPNIVRCLAGALNDVFFRRVARVQYNVETPIT
jgi:hypothetical protein